MKYNKYDFSKPNSIPTFELQTVDTCCPKCHCPIRLPIPAAAVDWESIANEYRSYANKMWEETNLILSEAGLDTLLEKQLQEILEKCKQALNL